MGGQVGSSFGRVKASDEQVRDLLELSREVSRTAEEVREALSENNRLGIMLLEELANSGTRRAYLEWANERILEGGERAMMAQALRNLIIPPIS